MGEMIGSVIAWLIMLFMVLGLYVVGYVAADLVGAAEHRNAAGFICIIATIWGYEHRVAQDRWTRLFADRRD